jgi:hypothetical protein
MTWLVGDQLEQDELQLVGIEDAPAPAAALVGIAPAAPAEAMPATARTEAMAVWPMTVVAAVFVGMMGKAH